MKISYNWLKEYLPTSLSPAELSDLLTATGLEVESLEKIETVPGGLEGLVVGEVKKKWPHPNADRLNLTQVDIGAEELLQIVCGAPNVAQGQKVVVAPVGTTLYSLSGEKLAIKKSKIRGEVSFGMICAEDEIGWGAAHEGIMVLPADVAPGTPLRDYFNVEEDWVLEIGLTPNRADAASHTGVARDVVAVLREKVRYPAVNDFQEGAEAPPVSVLLEDQQACIRYSGLVIEGLQVKESPRWLQDRLKAIGVKCINNIVDITNYVLHEIGQPLHAFDLKAIKGGEVRVKTLPQDTLFVTLDGVERKLSAKDLMICNAEEPMCIAGVFGGIDSGVTEETTAIFLESACFHPVSVRQTAKYHGLKTDASFRFERGTDPNVTLYALKRAALLMQEVADGRVLSSIIDEYPVPVAKREVEFSLEQATRLIGKELPAAEVRSILEHLEIEILREDGLLWTLAIPSSKVDVTREVDVIEEVLRIYGYDNIEMPAKVNASLSFSKKPDEVALLRSIADMLSGKGFFEIMTNSLGSSSHAALLRSPDPKQAVPILNPLSNELDQMRQSLLFSGLQSVAYNLNRKNSDLKFYEFGKVYELAGEGFREKKQLALFVTGRKAPESWNSRHEKADVFYLKGFVEAIMQKLGVGAVFVEPADTADADGGEMENAWQWKSEGAILVRSGRISNRIAGAFGIESPVFYAELDWEALMRLRHSHRISYREVPRFPSVRRDLSLLLDQHISFDRLQRLAFQADSQILKEVTIFDKYKPDAGQKGQLPAGKKSYALSFLLRDDQKTLTDKRVEQVMQRVLGAFEKEGVEIRT